MKRAAVEQAENLACAVGAYVTCGRLVIVAEELERKRFRDAQAVLCEAACGVSVALNREMYRVNTFGFFSGKVPSLTVTGEIYIFGYGDAEDDMAAAIYEFCGEDMEKVV